MATQRYQGEIPLHDGNAPRFQRQERWAQAANGDIWVRNATVPTLTPVLPAPGSANGAAVIVAPRRRVPRLVHGERGVRCRTMLEVNVPTDAPPMFVVLATDDPLFGTQGFGLVEAWRRARRPVEFHYYERGGARAQGMTSDRYLDAFMAWQGMHAFVDE
jgi:hypothetical protein